MPIRLICLDADDTLWHSETVFRSSLQRFVDLMAPFAEPDHLQQRLAETEHRNLAIFGYGVKGFVLSTIETALEIAGEGLTARTVREILAMGRAMMQHPVDLLPGVAEGLVALGARGRLVLVTKGDLFHQEAKLAASGLGASFTGVEIVSDKTADTYRRIFARYGTPPVEAVMAGNSMRSDIWPAIEAGAHAAHVPYPLVWDHEVAEAPRNEPRYRALSGLKELAPWIDELAGA